MSYTNYIIKDKDCNYLDANSQNASKMLLSCINPSQYIQSNIVPPQNNTVNMNGFETIEAFTNPGENYVPKGECPVGYKRNGDKCQQVCTHCTYRENEPNSRSMNEYDPCEPNGTFYGYDKNGYVKCLPKNKKKDLIKKAYTADGLFLSNDVKHLTYYEKPFY